MSTARPPDEPFHMIEAGEVGAHVAGVGLTLADAAGADYRVQRLQLGSPRHEDVIEIPALLQHLTGRKRARQCSRGRLTTVVCRSAAGNRCAGR
jgi:hypothetical protein